MDFPSLKVGCLAVVKERVCKLVNVAFSKPGKHGGAKKSVVGIDVINDKKLTESFRHGSIFHQFTVDTAVYSLSYVTDDGEMVLLDSNSEEVRDYNLPDDDIGKQIMELQEENPHVHVLQVKSDFQDDYRVVKVEK